MKTRALFDWALKQSPCLLVLDELDAIAPQRREIEMHTDEKRQVNELLTQLDRISARMLSWSRPRITCKASIGRFREVAVLT